MTIWRGILAAITITEDSQGNLGFCVLKLHPSVCVPFFDVDAAPGLDM